MSSQGKVLKLGTKIGDQGNRPNPYVEAGREFVGNQAALFHTDYTIISDFPHLLHLV